MPPDDQASNSQAVAREWQERADRCCRLADLLPAHKAGGRLAALAREIEEQMRESVRLTTVAGARKRHTTILLDAVEEIAGHIRVEFFFAQHLLRENSYTREALREEARVCREEAKAASAGSELRLGLARQADEFAQFAEGIARDDRDRGS